MQRGLTQVLFRYLPEAMFRYEDGRSWCRVTNITQREADTLRPALREVLRDLLAHWNALQTQGGQYPDPVQQPQRYIAGEPYHVYYTLFPLIFVCRTCHQVHFYGSLERLLQVNARLACRNNREHKGMTQLPYAFIHECGHLDTLYAPGGHTNHHLEIDDRSNFARSRWICRTCGGPIGTNGLGFRTCSCPTQTGKRPLMRGTLLQDSQVYYTHTISLLDIRDDAYLNWSRTPEATPFLLAGLCRLPEYDPKRLTQYAQAASAAQISDTEKATIRAALTAAGITDPDQQERTLEQMALQRAPEATARQALANRVSTLFPDEDTRVLVSEGRVLRELLYARDHPAPKTRPLQELIGEAQTAGDVSTMQRYEDDLQALCDLGLSDIRVMTDLPIVLGAVGFSRVAKEHKRVRSGKDINVTLRLFPATPQNRYPIYTAENTTEGMLFSLNPFQWAAWLAENNLVTLPAEGFADEPAVRAWLVQSMPQFLHKDYAYLQRLPWEDDATQPVDLPAAFSFGLLHSLSHLFLASAGSYVGFQTDSLSEYLFPVAGTGLLYASGNKEFTLGGIVSVFQQNLRQWLDGVRETAFRCLLDPVCHHKGGACHACLYLRFSCRHFNRTISRAFLIGGHVPGYPTPITGYWSTRVRARTAALGPSA